MIINISVLDSVYRKRLSLAILQLQSNQWLDLLKRKWWVERRGGGKCEVRVEIIKLIKN